MAAAEERREASKERGSQVDQRVAAVRQAAEARSRQGVPAEEAAEEKEATTEATTEAKSAEPTAEEMKAEVEVARAAVI